MSDPDDEAQGFDLGAVDYITKPVSHAIDKARVKNQLSLVRAAELEYTRLQIILKLGKAAEQLNAAPMHDLGKIGIPDSILQKPGPLDAEEWGVMKTHAAIGAQIIGHEDSS